MTKEKYKELTDQMLDEYMQEWHDWDLFIPSYAQAQEQERKGTLILEEDEGEKIMTTKNTNFDIDKACEEALGSGGLSRREILDEQIYYKEDEAAKKRKKELESFELSETQKRQFDEACGVPGEIDHSLDSAFAEAFGSGRSTERLQELKESIGSDEEGEQLLESVKIDLVDSNGSKPFKFSGRAFQTDIINSNGRRYSRSITEGALRQNRGGTLSVISGHPKPNDSDPSRVVGKVVFAENLDSAGWVTFEAQLSDTSLGKDLQILLVDKTISDVSLRSRGKVKQATVDGETVEDVVSLRFKGLDLVREGSFVGAKVDRIFS